MKVRKNYNAVNLSIAYLVALMLPVMVLAFTEHNSFWVTLVGFFLPLGLYSILAAGSHRSGRVIWWSLPLLFLSAFQLVISYLFGESVIAADMFINLLTTNPSEATELLCNIYPAVISVVVIYLPLLYFATIHLRYKVSVPNMWRRKLLVFGGCTLMLGAVCLLVGCRGNIKLTLRDKVFPINVCYNLGFSISEVQKIKKFDHTSQGFSYHATRKVDIADREVYILVIGEASRAANWQLYGYERPTNPQLVKRDDICLFRGVTTQSNTTHKSVPMILSSIHPTQYNQLYLRKGMPALFKEVGFTTYFISNQSPQGAMIDKLASDSDNVIYVDQPFYDGQMVDIIQKAIRTDPSSKMLFILHSYGSHFSYHRRYPRQFAIFLPEDDVAIARQNVEMIRNAYDNSILYTDYFLNRVIAMLDSYPSISSAVLYCSDHGEDIFDDGNGRFLHSSPSVTYHQLHVAALAWFSQNYKSRFGYKVDAAIANIDAPATTHSVFHTMADIASIRTPYLRSEASLVNPHFDYAAPRLYVNDHNEAVALDEKIGIDDSQRELFKRAGVDLKGVN